MHDLRGIDGIDRALRDGAAQVTSLEATYPVGTAVEPEAQVRAYAAATEAAVRDGFAGFRVAAEATPLVRTPQRLAAFPRYEHLVDRYMAEHPFSAMCAHSSAEIDDSAFAQLAYLHPNTSARSPGFRLHAADSDATALGGEVDFHAGSLFTQALDRVDLRARDGRLVLDATELTFIDHSGLLRLADPAAHPAAHLGAPLVLSLLAGHDPPRRPARPARRAWITPPSGRPTSNSSPPSWRATASGTPARDPGCGSVATGNT